MPHSAVVTHKMSSWPIWWTVCVYTTKIQAIKKKPSLTKERNVDFEAYTI